MLVHSTLSESLITGSPARSSPISPAVFNNKIRSLAKDQRLAKQLLESQQYSQQLRCQDTIYSFSPRIYDRVDHFLDQEGLDIVSPAGVVRRRITTLKPVIRTFGLGAQTSSLKKGTVTESASPEAAVPQFLLRRAVSLGETQSKKKLCVHAKDCNKMKNKLFDYILSEVPDLSEDDGSIS